MTKLKPLSYIGHRLRELGVYAQGWQQPSSNLSIAFCVDGDNNGFASELRGYALAEALKSFGWRSIIIPKQLEISQRYRILEIEKPAMLLLQSCRHLLNRPHLYPEQLCIFDLDDADFINPKLTNVVIKVAQESQGAIAGSRYTADFLQQHCKNVKIIWTGSQPLKYLNPPIKAIPPIVCWACSNPHQYIQENQLVQKILTNLSTKIPFHFWLMGVRDFNQGQQFIEPIIERGIQCKLIPFLPYQQLLDKLKQVSIGLAPLLPEEDPFCAGKSFGKVLAYLNSYVAVVASNTVDYPLFFKDSQNGFLASTIDEWTTAIEFLLANPNQCFEIAQRAREDYIANLSIQAVAQKTDQFLRQCLELAQLKK